MAACESGAGGRMRASWTREEKVFNERHSQRVDCCLSMCGDLVLAGASPGLTAQGLHLLAIFVATILGFILKPLPIGAIASGYHDNPGNYSTRLNHIQIP
jgi:DASS family divalent anion:Na+ symporter